MNWIVLFSIQLIESNVFDWFLVNCDKLPPCYYPQSACVAVNVPLECPRLCGLCDRYEVLKQVYGENNLALKQPLNPLPSKRISIGRKLKKISKSTTSMTTTLSDAIEDFQLESSASTMLSSQFSILFFAFFGAFIA